MNRRKTLVTDRLFTTYARNLTLYVPEMDNTFRCPICLTLFGREDLSKLSEEHIIPSAIGGKLTTLTCSKCNNTQGSKLEADLVKRLRVEDIFAGKSDLPLRGQVSAGNGKATADIYFSDERPNINIVAIPEHSNPAQFSNLNRRFTEGLKEFSISGVLGFNAQRSAVALIRSAYLMMFRYFGYGYILTEILDQVREQILHPDDDSFVRYGALHIKSRPPLTNAIAIVSEPIRCFLVLLNISTEIERYVAVVMPGLDEEGTDVYKRWADLGNDGAVNLVLNAKYIQYTPEFVTDPKRKRLPLCIWRNMDRLSDI